MSKKSSTKNNRPSLQQISPVDLDAINLNSIFQDIAFAVANARIIRPLTAEEKKEKCTCSHIKRYHVLANGKYICKYETCRCKGFILASSKKENK